MVKRDEGSNMGDVLWGRMRSRMSLHKGARLDRRREQKNKMVRRKRGFGKNSTSKNLKQSKKISENGYNAPAFDFIQDYRILVTQEVVYV